MPFWSYSLNISYFFIYKCKVNVISLLQYAYQKQYLTIFGLVLFVHANHTYQYFFVAEPLKAVLLLLIIFVIYVLCIPLVCCLVSLLLLCDHLLERADA